MRWSLARSLHIGSLLIGCASATFSAADDPPAPQSAPPPAEAPADAATEADPAAQQSDEPLTRETLTELIGEKRYQEALRRLEERIAAAPGDPMAGVMYATLSGAIGDDPSDTALVLLRKIVDAALAKPTLDDATARGASTAAVRLVMRDQQLSTDEKLDLLKRLEQKIPNDQPRLAASKHALLSRRVTTLIAADRLEEAQAALDDLVETPRKHADPTDSQSVLDFVKAVSTYQVLGARLFPERLEELVEEAETVSEAAMAQDDIDMPAVIAFFAIRQSHASALARSDPQAAAGIVEEMEQALDSARERLGPASLPALTTYTRSLQSLRTRIDAALKISAMLGTQAPEIDAESFVASEPVTMQDLRGKVVLIDFWAVWCGPCIHTFPHLIQWHEKYADRGLVILGATRYYGYRWDEQAERAVRAEDVSPEDELAMLEEFRASHQLRHGFFVTPADSEYQSAFSVTGIPHAVLIDQEGKIRMVRIGSGEANAKDLEEKIEELLGPAA